MSESCIIANGDRGAWYDALECIIWQTLFYNLDYLSRFNENFHTQNLLHSFYMDTMGTFIILLSFFNKTFFKQYPIPGSENILQEIFSILKTKNFFGQHVCLRSTSSRKRKTKLWGRSLFTKFCDNRRCLLLPNFAIKFIFLDD